MLADRCAVVGSPLAGAGSIAQVSRDAVDGQAGANRTGALTPRRYCEVEAFGHGRDWKEFYIV